MAVLTDIKRMQAEGRTEKEIIDTLSAQGISPREMTEALSQSRIREAVAGEYAVPAPESKAAPLPPEAAMEPEAPTPAEYAPSPAPTAEAAAPQPYAPYPSPAVSPPSYPEYAPYQYPQYAPQPAISTDTLTEISEQVVTEKLAPLRKEIEKIIDLKTSLESKMEFLDERLKRMEKIIDRLQLSILQKVGDYMTNIEDIKKELIETQKSFKSLVPSLEKQEKPKKLPSPPSPK